MSHLHIYTFSPNIFPNFFSLLPFFFHYHILSLSFYYIITTFPGNFQIFLENYFLIQLKPTYCVSLYLFIPNKQKKPFSFLKIKSINNKTLKQKQETDFAFEFVIFLMGQGQSKSELLYQQVSYGNSDGIKTLHREGAGLEVNQFCQNYHQLC
jgi:hypothetical protein